MERIGHRVDQQRAFEPRERTRRIVTGQQSGGGTLRPRRNIPGRLAERFGQHRRQERPIDRRFQNGGPDRRIDFAQPFAQFGFRDRPIGVEPSLVLPADVGSAPLEDSGHADPLHRPEARIVGRQVEVRQQVAARIEHRLLHPAHRDFGRIDARRRGQRRQGSRCLPDLQHDRLQARGAVDEVGYRDRFFGYEQPRKSCGDHDAQRKTVRGDGMEIEVGQFVPARIAGMVLIDRIIAHADRRTVKRSCVGVGDVVERKTHGPVNAPRFAVIGNERQPVLRRELVVGQSQRIESQLMLEEIDE